MRARKRSRRLPFTSNNTALLTPSLELFEHYVAIARAIPSSEVRTARVDANLVCVNAARGVAAILGRADEAAALPGTSLEQVRGLAKLGSALAYAAERVERYRPAPRETRALLARAFALRTSLLAKADVLVLDKIVPKARVAALHRGKGPRHAAADCIALAALFHEYANALSKSIVIAAATVQEADDVGRRLRASLRPMSAKHAPDPDYAAIAEARDRLWTLFERTWARHVWRPGAYLFGRTVDKHVPPLTSRVAAKREARPRGAPSTSTAAAPPTSRSPRR